MVAAMVTEFEPLGLPAQRPTDYLMSETYPKNRHSAVYQLGSGGHNFGQPGGIAWPIGQKNAIRM